MSRAIMFRNKREKSGWNPEDLLDGKYSPKRFGTFKENIDIDKNGNISKITQRNVYSVLKKIKEGDEILCYDNINSYYYANIKVVEVSSTKIDDCNLELYKKSQYKDHFYGKKITQRGDITFERVDHFTQPLYRDELDSYPILNDIKYSQRTITELTEEQYELILKLLNNKNKN